jgi:hypothetical protein
MTEETGIINHLYGANRSMQLYYEWDESADQWLIRQYMWDYNADDFPFDTSHVLHVYVFGDGSGNLFRFSVRELNGVGSPNLEVSQWITIDWLGWKLVQWDLSDAGSVGSWLGNGILDGSSYHFDSFQISHAEGAAQAGTVYFDDLQFVSPFDVTSVDDISAEPVTEFSLQQNYPNPFNPDTRIVFSVPQSGPVTLRVYNLLGQVIAVLVDENLPAGRHLVRWSPRNVASGTYIYELRQQERVVTRRMVLVK